MFLSNKLISALRTHRQMIDDGYPIAEADSFLIQGLDWLEEDRKSCDYFRRPSPVPVRVDKNTGKILESKEDMIAFQDGFSRNP